MKNNKKYPPKAAEIIFKLFLRDDDAEHRLGDFQEIYQYKLRSEGKIKAHLWYWLQLTRSIPQLIFNNIIWESAMFNNYLKIAFRNIIKTKFYSGLNIFGLAAGLTGCMLISLYVIGEFSFDDFHKNGEKIYRMNWDYNWNGNSGISSGTPPPLAKTMLNEIPGIESATRIYKVPQTVVRKDESFFNEDKILGVDSNFLDIFSFQLIKGNSATAFSEPGSVVLTVKAAEKYFGSTDIIGKSIIIGKDSKFLGRPYFSSFKVTGIAADTPENSHIQFDMLTSISSYPQVAFFDWSWVWMQLTTYVKLDKLTSVNELDGRVNEMISKHVPLTLKRIGFSYDEMINSGGRWNFTFQSLNDIYLGSSDIGNRLGPNGSETYLYVFILVAVFIIIIACINFMNLSTARSFGRAKEIGVRKVLGSARKNLIAQFMSEALLQSFAAMIFALVLTYLLIVPFENVSGVKFSASVLNTSWILPVLILGTIIIGIAAGIYPSFFLSSFKPADVLKGQRIKGKRNQTLRNSLVIMQFAISIALIASTFIVYSQMRFLKEKDLGFDKENILVVSNENHLLGSKAEAFTDLIKNNTSVVNASLSTGIPPNSGYGDFYKAEGNDDEQFDLFSYMVDNNFINTLGIDIIKGHGFSNEFGTNAEGVIINESAAKLFGWENPVGKTLNYPSKGNYKVIGLMKDFNFFSLHSPIMPFALFHESSDSYNIDQSFIVIKLRANDASNVISAIKKDWAKFAPGTPFSYSFLDDKLDSQYRSEERLGNIFLIFATLAVMIACFGLLGLAAFTAEKRKKEIGIRKTLGANVQNVLVLLLKDFTKWVILANILAVPAAWYAMHTWLQNFAYRIEIGYSEFILAALSALLIAVATVAYQAVKASIQNPVDIIKYE